MTPCCVLSVEYILTCQIFDEVDKVDSVIGSEGGAFYLFSFREEKNIQEREKENETKLYTQILTCRRLVFCRRRNQKIPPPPQEKR